LVGGWQVVDYDEALVLKREITEGDGWCVCSRRGCCRCRVARWPDI